MKDVSFPLGQLVITTHAAETIPQADIEEGLRRHYLPELSELTMTQLAQGYGLKKQSVGRWVEVFKLDFPWFKSPKLQNPDK